MLNDPNQACKIMRSMCALGLLSFFGLAYQSDEYSKYLISVIGALSMYNFNHN
jgi:hypothetical protein